MGKYIAANIVGGESGTKGANDWTLVTKSGTFEWWRRAQQLTVAIDAWTTLWDADSGSGANLAVDGAGTAN